MVMTSFVSTDCVKCNLCGYALKLIIYENCYVILQVSILVAQYKYVVSWNYTIQYTTRNYDLNFNTKLKQNKKKKSKSLTITI